MFLFAGGSPTKNLGCLRQKSPTKIVVGLRQKLPTKKLGSPTKTPDIKSRPDKNPKIVPTKTPTKTSDKNNVHFDWPLRTTLQLCRTNLGPPCFKKRFLSDLAWRPGPEKCWEFPASHLLGCLALWVAWLAGWDCALGCGLPGWLVGFWLVGWFVGWLFD